MLIRRSMSQLDSERKVVDIHTNVRSTGSPRFAPVQFAPIQNNADFETRRSKSQNIYILQLFIKFYNFSRTASSKS
jgi:hypothetical protein